MEKRWSSSLMGGQLLKTLPMNRWPADFIPNILERNE
jgi:hypothetical protein